MAYQVTGTSTQYITATAPVTAAAFTISCWSRFSSTTGNKWIVSLSNTATGDRFLLYYAGQLLSFFVNSSAGFAQPQSASAAANTWHHCAAIEESAASHWIYLNGTGTQSTTSRTPSGINGLTIGADRINNGVTTFANGNVGIADLAIWNVALTAAEITSLSKGMSADNVRRSNLVFYAPLVRELIDIAQARALTNTNSCPVADHPRIY
jgi:hypothetical protein